MELVRAMLIAKSLPSFLWDEAAKHAVYLRNRAPTRALKGKTPYEAWTGLKPNISHLREFGCDVWVLDETVNRSKLAPRSKKMVFVGFEEGCKGIRYWDKATRKIKVSRNIAFNENEEPTMVRIAEVPGTQAEGESEAVTASMPDPELPHVPTKPETNTRTLRPKTKIDYN
jgi:hypothetical protein